MEEAAKVIIITGTPGVGKTTIAKELAAKLSAHLVSIGELVRKENLVDESDVERGTVIVDIKKLKARLRTILKRTKNEIIVEGHYAYDVVPRSVNPYVFVLRRDPDALETVLRGRGYDERKISENVAAEVLDVCLIGAMKRYGKERVDEIDATYMDAVAVVNEILEVMRGGKPVESGKVDWLGKLEEDGRLERFLSQMVRVEGIEYGHLADDGEA